MLVGIVVTNAIVLIDLVNQYRERGQSVVDALLDGTSRRVRPVLMTALATIFALLPLGIGVTGFLGQILLNRGLALSPAWAGRDRQQSALGAPTAAAMPALIDEDWAKLGQDIVTDNVSDLRHLASALRSPEVKGVDEQKRAEKLFDAYENDKPQSPVSASSPLSSTSTSSGVTGHGGCQMRKQRRSPHSLVKAV